MPELGEKRLKWRKFLLSFFKSEEGNDEHHINGFVLFKYWSGNLKMWMVDVYTEESFEAREKYYEKREPATLL